MSDFEIVTMTPEQRAAFKLAIAGSESVVTGASPIFAIPAVAITRITTGGTAGNEDVYLKQFVPADPDGYTVVNQNGVIHTFVLDHQTDDSDVVRVYQMYNDGVTPTTTEAKDAQGTTIARMDFATLDYEGATMSYVWWDYNWFLIDTQQNNSNEYTFKARYVASEDINELSVADINSIGLQNINNGVLIFDYSGTTYRIIVGDFMTAVLNGGLTKNLALENHADDAAAAVALIPVGGMYRTGGAVKVRVS